ncbi:MAG TPA: hypothetical protein VN831_08260, partial [Bradyrhizobium sp.]|nr:hypothetical protein [Bradyrhizobium sp.]
MPAGHYAFLPPCSPQLAANLPRFCTDPPGFDRTAFHRNFQRLRITKKAQEILAAMRKKGMGWPAL